MNDALRTALRAAGARLAAKAIHGRFHIERRARGAAVVTFVGADQGELAIDVEALVEASLALQAVGLPAQRFGYEHVFISPTP